MNEDLDKAGRAEKVEEMISNLGKAKRIMYSLKRLVEKIIKLAKENKTYLVADSQSSSQIGDVSRFKNVNLITPTEHEARVSLKNYDDGLVIIAEKLRKITNNEHLILTLGKDGIVIQTKNSKKIISVFIFK